jgi:elongation factor G
MSQYEAHNRSIVSVAITPRASDDHEKLQTALSILIRKFPGIQIKTGSSDSEIILGGMSELHLEQICDRVLLDYNILLDLGEPDVMYLETIRKPAEGEGKYIRQTGGAGNYGHCKIRLTPKDSGHNYEFINTTKNDVIPERFIELIDQGVRDALENGILFGYPLVGLTATLYDGSYHDTDSNEMAFKFAGSFAAKEAARKTSPVLVEPIMAVEVNAPEEYMGTIIRGINSRRGRIEVVEQAGKSKVIRAVAPLAEMLGYGKYIRANARGQATHSMQFLRYETTRRPDQDGAGVTANKPTDPKTGSRSATVRPDAELDY